MTRILLSVDAEGMPYTPYKRMMMPGDPIYSELREIMTRVTNKFVESLFEHGVKEVIVADSHGAMVNLDPFKIDRRVHLVRGFPRPLSMITGAETVDAAMFIGYHTCPQTGGVLAHTYSGRIIQRVRLAIEENASEYLLNALALGEMGKPVVLVAGDEALREQVKKHTPWAVFIPLKKPASSLADITPPWRDIEVSIENGVKSALELHEAEAVQPLLVEEKWIEVELKRPYHADVAELFPCVKRLNGVTVRIECDKFTESFKLLEGIVMAAYSLER